MQTKQRLGSTPSFSFLKKKKKVSLVYNNDMAIMTKKMTTWQWNSNKNENQRKVLQRKANTMT